jgi:hypothetical protein
MFRTARTRLTLAAVAAAIVGTALAPLAPAAQAASGLDSQHGAPKPDVTVSGLSMNKHAGDDDYLVTVNIKNIGTATSGAIPVKGECSDVDGDRSLVFANIFAPLTVGDGHTVQFLCPSGTWGTRVTISTQNDANIKNNVATAGAFF